MKKLILVILIILLAIVCVLNIRVRRVNIIADNDMYILSNVGESGSYTLIDSNKAICDLATFSYLVRSMEADGYKINREEYTNDYIDIVLTNEDLSFRMHYTLDGNFTSICDIYEKSYIPFTYINGIKEKGGL